MFATRVCRHQALIPLILQALSPNRQPHAKHSSHHRAPRSTQALRSDAIEAHCAVPWQPDRHHLSLMAESRGHNFRVADAPSMTCACVLGRMGEKTGVVEPILGRQTLGLEEDLELVPAAICQQIQTIQKQTRQVGQERVRKGKGTLSGTPPRGLGTVLDPAVCGMPLGCRALRLVLSVLRSLHSFLKTSPCGACKFSIVRRMLG